MRIDVVALDTAGVLLTVIAVGWALRLTNTFQ